MPLIPCPDCQTEVSDRAPACPKCGRPIAPPVVVAPPPAQVVITQAPPPKKKTSPAAWGCLVLILLAIGGTILSEARKGPSGSVTSISAPAAPDPHEEALSGLKLDYDWKLGGFGNVILATFRVQNQNVFAVKDLQIRCEAFGKSGTKIDRNTRTIYDVIKAKGKKTIPEANLGLVNSQAHTLNCQIIDFAKAS